jgi:hypothetical protein
MDRDPDTDNTAASSAAAFIKPSPEAAAAARELWQSFARRGIMKLEGWRPTRDEMHDREDYGLDLKR